MIVATAFSLASCGGMEEEFLDNSYVYIADGSGQSSADINDIGMILQGMYRGTNAGNKVLADYVKKRKPKYYFCGHIHSGNHMLTDVGGTKMANVSIMDEDYNPVHFPLVLDITKENLG